MKNNVRAKIVLVRINDHADLIRKVKYAEAAGAIGKFGASPPLTMALAGRCVG